MNTYSPHVQQFQLIICVAGHGAHQQVDGGADLGPSRGHRMKVKFQAYLQSSAAPTGLRDVFRLLSQR